jgi:hypothetical protein
VRSLFALAALVPALGLPTAPGWTSRSTGATDRAVRPAQVWATNQADAAGLVPLEVFGGLLGLHRNGIVLWATVDGRGGPDRTFVRSAWPVQLGAFRLDHGWEGQPAARIQQRLIWIAVGGWHLDIRVYFGTNRPSRALVAKAQAELDRLQLPTR